MRLTDDGIKRIIDDIGDSPLLLAAAINDMLGTIKLLDEINDEIQDIQNDATKRINQLKIQILDIRDDMCQHYERRHHPDPSGGSDSYTECLICGKHL